MSEDDSLDDKLEKFWGEPVYSYTDQDAVNDGVLVPFIAGKRDTLHQITSNAFNELSVYHRNNMYPNYDDAEFYRFFFYELLPLVGEARRVYGKGDILKTTFDFLMVKDASEEILWYVPNEVGGITMMLPSDC